MHNLPSPQKDIFQWFGKIRFLPPEIFPLTPPTLYSNFYLADVITLMNGICGVQSVLSSMRYLLSNDVRDLYSSLIFMPLGMMFDFMDGRVARWRNNSSLLGQELDSLADLVCIRGGVYHFCFVFFLLRYFL
jgi:phosphatidylglycerophosphate synthase